MQTHSTFRMASLAAFTLVILAACGGGGGGGNEANGHDLAVTFNYGSPIESYDLWVPFTRSPSLTGLGSNTPTCVLAGGALPEGVRVDQTTCNLSGTPTETGEFAFSVRLTVSGFSGSVSADGNVAVRAPALSYFGKSIEHLSWREESTSSPQWVGYQPSAGDTVRNYRVEDANLPLGLSIDPDTGTISGTFTGLSSARFTVAATITHGNRTIDVRTGVIEPLVLAPSVVYADTTAPTGKVGTAYVLPAPTFDDGSAIGAGYVGLFTIDQSLSGPCQTPGPLPMGLQLNAATGAISGTPTETLSWCFAVKYEVTASDGSSVVGRLRPPIIIVP